MRARLISPSRWRLSRPLNMFRVLLRDEKLSVKNYCQPPHKPDSKEDLRVHVGQGEEGEDASGQGGVPEQGQGVPG